jgi:uncharacterized iron-regulated protein
MNHTMDNRFRACAALMAALLLAVAFAARAASTECVPVGAWAVPGAASAKPIAVAELLPRLARQSVVLLGESHDSAEDHRWQLQTVAALYAMRPQMALAFEAFPRRLQPVLDRWVAGEYTEAEFLKAVDWARVWNFDSQLYLPLFNFARMNRVAMVAMNVEITLIRAVGAKGLASVSPETREGVSPPAAPTNAYIDDLLQIYGNHQPGGSPHKEKLADRNDPAFRRFVESQQVWDRAMAQAIAQAASRPGAPLVVGILGKGHVEEGYGVAHQLADLGVKNVSSLLPWHATGDCKTLTAGYADAVFGVAAEKNEAAPARPRLGVAFETAGKELRVTSVEKGSIAETTGIKEGDVLLEAAGSALKDFAELRGAVQRQAPGTWLPLKIRRQNETLELIAKFPPAKS